MHEMGISYVQGYYFSQPLEKNEFVKYLAENTN
jgi:EAL domain-containing protein (putative c-di-GMP-specific phosphodiesterase class I)